MFICSEVSARSFLPASVTAKCQLFWTMSKR